MSISTKTVLAAGDGKSNLSKLKGDWGGGGMF